MKRKIIGVTVGTPISPSTIDKEIKPVKSINDVKPDEDGNVTIKADAATAIDLSKLDTEGKITESYADGTSKTTTMEFDENGNPTKITDGDGHETVLTW